MDKLLPCPFCGSDAVKTWSNEYGDCAHCENEDCAASAFYDRMMVVEWNTRHTTDRWRPIDAAPEGMEILVYAPMDGVVSSIYKHGCWQKLSIVYGKGLDNDPTHWMPLPVAQKTED